MTNEQKIELLADVFECEPAELKPQMNVEDTGNWDSMTKLSLIVLMDDNFSKKLTKDELKGFKTIADILAYMG